MKVSFDMSAAREDEEVLVFAMVGADVTCALARLHWFVERDGHSETRVQAWQSTWDGGRMPGGWRPYAWASIEAPDPAEGDVV